MPDRFKGVAIYDFDACVKFLIAKDIYDDNWVEYDFQETQKRVAANPFVVFW